MLADLAVCQTCTLSHHMVAETEPAEASVARNEMPMNAVVAPWTVYVPASCAHDACGPVSVTTVVLEMNAPVAIHSATCRRSVAPAPNPADFTQAARLNCWPCVAGMALVPVGVPPLYESHCASSVPAGAASMRPAP